MKKRLLTMLLLIALSPALTGCSYSYLERQAFPLCMSIDIDQNGRYTVGVQAPQSSTDSSPVYDILTATGDSLLDAMRVLAASTPYPLNFCQLRLCLISYQLAATTELRTLLRTVYELPTMRPNAYVMISMGNALEVMEAQKPDFGTRLSTQLQLLFERLRETKMLPDSTLSACVRELGGVRRDPMICVCAVNTALVMPKEDQSPDGGSSSGDSSSGDNGGEKQAFAIGEPWSDILLPENLLAGMLPRTGTNPVEYLGSAVVSDGRVSGLMTARETQVLLRAYDEAERRVAIDGKSMQLQIFITSGTELDIERETLRSAMEKLLDLDSDALAFGAAAVTGFYTDAEWEGFNFKRRYKQADLVIQ